MGKFNLQKHKGYLDKNPAKRPKLPMEARKHVSHFYTDGDVCDITGRSNFFLKANFVSSSIFENNILIVFFLKGNQGMWKLS